MMNHRIRLRGPWILAIDGSAVTASRSFHAPTGIEAASRVELGWETPKEVPIVELRLNQHRITIEELSMGVVEGALAIQRLEVGGILERFNLLVLVWNTPSDSVGLEVGKYTPHPHHPLHVDSWLEIHEELP